MIPLDSYLMAQFFNLKYMVTSFSKVSEEHFYFSQSSPFTISKLSFLINDPMVNILNSVQAEKIEIAYPTFLDALDLRSHMAH